MTKTAVYVHFPFCLQKCLYCDFASATGLEHLYESYLDALCREIKERSSAFQGAVVDTIYFGGGTPAILPLPLLEKAAEAIFSHLPMANKFEFTIEANPGSLKRELLAPLKAIGINRLSLGVQSFDNSLLKSLGRIHSAAEAQEAVQMALGADFNVNLDLMYALPEQTLAQLQESLAIAVQSGVNHISAYGLKIEPGVPFFDLREQGLLPLPDAELEEAMYDLVIDYLTANGYARYEISNFARPGFECAHNLKYWRYAPYAGFGAAAHSFWGGARFFNPASITEYIEQMKAGNFACAPEEISCQEQMAEFIFLALRTTEGLSYQEFQNCFGVPFLEEYGALTAKFITAGLMQKNTSRVFLTRLGLKFSNQVFQEFLPD
ncbi:MAG: radical SAM family heme chaperone HemW [Sporomusaceae bacterium]|jgi:oxygen-independent coproporphyrinogen-3 oxidase|nr:radical SAM family heme chaperone HemW [Sporomusaceae bacterium]